MKLRWLAGLGLALLLWAGGTGSAYAQAEGPAAADTAKTAAAAAEADAAKVELEGESRYLSTGRRDPFRPFTLDLRVPESDKEPLTPLQKYEIGQLTLAGVVVGMNPPRAMVEDNIGMGYIVTVGTPIGRNGGVVTDISTAEVTVEERMRDFFGREMVKEVVMKLPSENGSDQQGLETRERQ